MASKFAYSDEHASVFKDLLGSDDPSKVAPDEVGYVDRSPRAGKNCDGCTMFIPPPGSALSGSCSLVEGSINPRGWCRRWEEA